MSGETRERAVALLSEHQQRTAACLCGEAPDTSISVDTRRRAAWMAAHQIDVLAAAGIEPFAVDRVVTS